MTTANELVDRWWLSLRIEQRQIRIYRRSIAARKDRATRRAHPKMLYWQGRPLNYAVARRLRRRFFRYGDREPFSSEAAS